MDTASTTAFTPLLDDDDSPIHTTPSSSFASFSHLIDVTQPCPLLDTLPPIRSMMLDYMDDRTAIHYLSTCQSLHVLYHHYPLKQAMTEWAFRDTTQLEAYFERLMAVPVWLVLLAAAIVFPTYIVSWYYVNARSSWDFWHNTPWAVVPVSGVVVIVCVAYLVWRLVLSRRVNCCTRGRWGMWRRRHIMPRVTRLRSAGLRDVRLLPYLQHLTELTIAYDKYKPFDKKNPLPASLRTLHLLNSPDLSLKANTLPPRLTSLSLSAVRNTPLPAGVLPESLTSLQLLYGFDTRWTIGKNVLPSNLQRLELHEWTLPLSNIVLPASLTELDIRWLSNHLLPALPPQLQLLAIGGAFNQPLVNALPSSLHILRLTGHFEQPLTATVFASTPQLEELHLSDHSSQQLDVSVLPRSLHVRCGLVSAARW